LSEGRGKLEGQMLSEEQGQLRRRYVLRPQGLLREDVLREDPGVRRGQRRPGMLPTAASLWSRKVCEMLPAPYVRHGLRMLPGVRSLLLLRRYRGRDLMPRWHGLREGRLHQPVSPMQRASDPWRPNCCC
jgi:hypothetical protein